MYKPKNKSESSTNSSESLPTAKAEPKRAFTALAIKPAGRNLFQLLEFAFDENNNLIDLYSGPPQEIHMAIHAQKMRASYVWTGLV